MAVRVVGNEGSRIVIQLEVDTGSCRDLAECEESIQEVLNEAGTLATAELLKRFDTNGQPLERDGRRYTSKGEVLKRYETPYGTAEVARHVYQHSGGGATYCPLDERAGIVLNATPKFARMVASKYAEFGSARVQEDMAENHGRHFSRGYVSKLAEAVAAIAESDSEQAKYRLPEFDTPTMKLLVAVDEIAITSFRPGPARVAIASIGFYDGLGQRQYVVYLSDLFDSEGRPDGRLPDLGRFLARLEKEQKRASRRLGTKADPPDGLSAPGDVESQEISGEGAPRSQAAGTPAAHGTIVGISGGQPWSTDFLQRWATVQFVEPAKVEAMLSEAAAAYFDRSSTPEGSEEDPEELAARRRRDKRRWVQDARYRILYEERLSGVIAELEAWMRDMPRDPGQETIAKVIEFLRRERDAGRMNYKDPRAPDVFANAGILADSAKVIFGDRIGHPKYKIGLSAARAILILRELTRTPGRWEEFWSRTTRKDGSGARPDP